MGAGGLWRRLQGGGSFDTLARPAQGRVLCRA